MAKNTIAVRVADFLKKYPPFDIISPDDLLHLSKEVTIIYLEKGKVLFNAGDATHDYFYIVKEGAIELKQLKDDVFKMVDVCDEGDVFGIRPLLNSHTYEMAAIAEEETILYGVPLSDFTPILNANANVGLFLIDSFASKHRNPFEMDYSKFLYQNTNQTNYQNFFELQPVPFKRKVVKAQADTPIQEVARLMTQKQVSSMVIVNEAKFPIGIITDKDLRKQIATGYFSLDMKASQCMSSPVKTYTRKMTVSEAQFQMIKHNIGRLIITEDGTDQSPVRGILTPHDIEVTRGHDVPGLMKAIKRAQKSKHLKRIRQQSLKLLKGYVLQNIPLSLITDLFHQLFEAINVKAIELCIKRMETPPPVRFAWMSLGSHGRKEQFLITDQDNALVFENVAPDKYEEVQQYFLTLADKINTMLYKIGYEYCPADMMAKNPKWCMSLSHWKEQFAKWINTANNEDLLMFSIFYDICFTFGEQTLVDKLMDSVFDKTKYNERFFALMTRSTLENPSPLGIFRNFIVEQDGEHKDQFDIKSRAITTLTDIGRLLILSHKVKGITNTAERFEKLAEIEPQNKNLYLSCASAAKTLLKFRIKNGLANDNNGRYIDIKQLKKEDKIKSKQCFKAISNAQELIKMRFKAYYV
ncbi:DUF294 nucleotidyltransferase-like domain-containing protein [Capnocytophaga catalasegens]|uniref:Nucleotidyltransferase n=1 Tax=Capnocytophaga catalasegens TaxID=1004260 RepID=A0AAV5AZ96_9FLAO|nr:DUF294 nucleotidyltransferase-like domain-containing protein [Capnocytophaga catalasegens]GIZ16144.1 nucleotidyltransferase [Capnocytophaga catalasegens]GJM50912.1 nucleotidyltransferase [Capnocytophaga catalasegens]GJM53756.1 nucleotidyltransferase [Capnocytophaga catalasegens]